MGVQTDPMTSIVRGDVFSPFALWVEWGLLVNSKGRGVTDLINMEHERQVTGDRTAG